MPVRRMLAGGAVAFGAALSLAPAPLPAQEVIHACYGRATGLIYRIRAPGLSDECLLPRLHTEFQWNVEGPPGPQGPQGEPGPTGPPGPPGSSAGLGDLHYPTVVGAPSAVAPGGSALLNLSVNCPVGARPLNGGYRLNRLVGSFDGIQDVDVLTNGPSLAPGWAVTIRLRNGGATSLTAQLEVVAICVETPSS